MEKKRKIQCFFGGGGKILWVGNVNTFAHETIRHNFPSWFKIKNGENFRVVTAKDSFSFAGGGGKFVGFYAFLISW